MRFSSFQKFLVFGCLDYFYYYCCFRCYLYSRSCFHSHSSFRHWTYFHRHPFAKQTGPFFPSFDLIPDYFWSSNKKLPLQHRQTRLMVSTFHSFAFSTSPSRFDSPHIILGWHLTMEKIQGMTYQKWESNVQSSFRGCIYPS